MLEKIERILTRYRMLNSGDHLGVAVSGGADSVCLLHLLRQLAPAAGVSLSVVHLNHQLRGDASDADALFVAGLAQAYGLPLHNASRPVGPSEDDARQARRTFFAHLRDSGLVTRIATGHTLDDQAETVLFRLLRGAGPAGLAGILPVTHEGLIRPLLDVSRAEVVGYLRHHALDWRVDASNADPRFARNRIRQVLLPTLVRDWNPHLAPQLARTAEIARDEDAYLATLVPPPLATDDAVLLETSLLPVALRRRQVRWAIGHLGGHAPDFAHVEAIVALCQSLAGTGRLQTPGIDALRSFDWVRLARLADAGNRNWSQPLPVFGFVSFPGGEIRTTLGTIGGESFCLDAAGDSLVLRNWRPGDAYSPVGLLKSRFEAERVPLWERRNWPIIAAGSEIVWSKRFGAATRFRAVEGRRNCAIHLSDNRGKPLSWFREIESA
ncbi:MAG: tRNA lysidine(34) synthetase TilS [Bryobacteraceae bacterium]|nr:tRNA lysidine(34) synthetase TilS [Bryobacteraceae bacterium]